VGPTALEHKTACGKTIPLLLEQSRQTGLDFRTRQVPGFQGGIALPQQALVESFCFNNQGGVRRFGFKQFSESVFGAAISADAFVVTPKRRKRLQRQRDVGKFVSEQVDLGHELGQFKIRILQLQGQKEIERLHPALLALRFAPGGDVDFACLLE
jgi:hypothetical protein